MKQVVISQAQAVLDEIAANASDGSQFPTRAVFDSAIEAITLARTKILHNIGNRGTAVCQPLLEPLNADPVVSTSGAGLVPSRIVWDPRFTGVNLQVHRKCDSL
jgi:hypothetical protein